ncbi:probable G-protein coupled receptor B0563.6 [Mizuhopecten yessoensis]|uniref:G-protein coupled receptor B0563.6 n=1 Tax=Mizuhopecten yessoensis TaxID=6573 RepID=A0A210PXL5_MIZYE|nr:probable G-protein coupled receptor B0563.6 [Mizuhopecten yessoensis]OWF41216.1 G-protein coupled receptor B0563.6 [Mizuhopecten yessoensis]
MLDKYTTMVRFEALAEINSTLIGFDYKRLCTQTIPVLKLNVTAGDNETNLSRELDQISAAINLYFPPILVVMGTICNCIVIKVMRSMYFRFLSTSFYMAINAFIDNFSLLFLLTVHWINANFPWIIYRGINAHFMCKAFNFFGWTSSDLGILLTAAMTLERSLAITFPLKAQKWCSVSRAKHMSLLLLVLAMIKNAHFLFTSGLMSQKQRYKLCEISSNNKNMVMFWRLIWPWIHHCFLFIMFTVIIISNIIILRHVKLSYIVQKAANVYYRTGSKKVETRTQVSTNPRSRRRQILMMLLADSITIVICTLPFSIYTSVTSNVVIEDDEAKSVDILIYSASFYLLYINRCANFYLYCLSGSRFRFALKFVCTYKRTMTNSYRMKTNVNPAHETLIDCQLNATVELGDERRDTYVCRMCEG